MPQLDKSLKGIAQKRGLYLGGILVLALTLVYFINWDILLEYWYEVVKLPIIIGIAVMAAVEARKKHRGEFSFRDGFSLFFVTVVIGLTLSLLAKWLFYNYFDPDFGRYINDMGIQERKRQLQLTGTAPKEIAKEISELKASYQLSFKKLFQEYIFRLVAYCMPAVLVALILKTKKPLIR